MFDDFGRIRRIWPFEQNDQSSHFLAYKRKQQTENWQFKKSDLTKQLRRRHAEMVEVYFLATQLGSEPFTIGDDDIFSNMDGVNTSKIRPRNNTCSTSTQKSYKVFFFCFCRLSPQRNAQHCLICKCYYWENSTISPTFTYSYKFLSQPLLIGIF